MSTVPEQAPRRHAGGRPPLPRYYVTVLISVDVGANTTEEAEHRAELLMGHALGTVNPKRPGRPRIAAIHVGRAFRAGE